MGCKMAWIMMIEGNILWLNLYDLTKEAFHKPPTLNVEDG
jgi:hypothetical protein